MGGSTSDGRAGRAERLSPLVDPTLRIMLAGSLLLVVIGALTGGGLTMWVSLACAVAFGLALRLFRSGYVMLGTVLPLVALHSGALYAMYVGQGIHDIAILTLPVDLMLACLLLSRTQAGIFTVTTVLVMGLFGIAEHQRWLPYDEVEMVDVIDAYLAVVILAALGVLIHFFVDKLVRTQESYAQIFNATHEAIFIHDAASGRILDVNDTMLRMYGYERDEVERLDAGALALPDPSTPRIEEVVKLAAEQGPQVLEWRARRKDGAAFWVEVTLRPYELGSARRVLGVVRDIDARKEVEERSRQAEKLRALGQLAGGVAHDFNNLLAGIAGFAQLLAREHPRGTPAATHVEGILKTTQRAADLTTQLLAFAREEPRKTERTDVIALIGEVVELARRSFDPRVELVFEPHGAGVTTLADPALVHGALLNLCVNARDAMPDGGRLVIRTRTVTVESVEAAEDAAPGDYLEIAVADQGTGMTPDVLARAFEPFFTTKAHGTGMGLAMVYGTLRAHGGFVRVESELGRGTTFRLALPLRAEAELRPDAQVSESTSELGLRVLIAEDEPNVAFTTRTLLEHAGCVVSACADGAEAVEVFRAAPATFDVVLLDLSMPRLSGDEALKEIRHIDPNARVVLTSGYTTDAAVEELTACGAVGFLAKPYAFDALARTLAAAARPRDPAPRA